MSDPRTDLAVNTTEHLLADIERLRPHLDIDRWLLFEAMAHVKRDLGTLFAEVTRGRDGIESAFKTTVREVA